MHMNSTLACSLIQTSLSHTGYCRQSVSCVESRSVSEQNIFGPYGDSTRFPERFCCIVPHELMISTVSNCSYKDPCGETLNVHLINGMDNELRWFPRSVLGLPRIIGGKHCALSLQNSTSPCLSACWDAYPFRQSWIRNPCNAIKQTIPTQPPLGLGVLANFRPYLSYAVLMANLDMPKQTKGNML